MKKKKTAEANLQQTNSVKIKLYNHVIHNTYFGGNPLT